MLGQYLQPDPLGVLGQLHRNARTAKLEKVLEHDFQWVGRDSGADDVRVLAGLPDRQLESVLYGYAGNRPLQFTDPTGELWGQVAAAAIIISGVAIGGAYYLQYKCEKQCIPSCPIPETGDPLNDQSRANWIVQCQLKCTKGVADLLRKYTSPTPPVEGVAH